MMQGCLALLGWLHLGTMLALVGERTSGMPVFLRIALSAGVVIGVGAWCALQPFGSPLRILPLAPAVVTGLAIYLGANSFRDARGVTSYLLAVSTSLVTRELALALGGQGGWLVLVLAAVLPTLAEFGWARLIRGRYLSLQHEMVRSWRPAALVYAVLLAQIYLVVCVPSPVAARPKDYPQALLVLALAPLVQLSVLGTVSRHFELLRARERERILRLSSERMGEALGRVAEAERVLSIRRHDLRHHWAALDELMSACELDRARAYAAELKDRQDPVTSGA